MTLAALVLCAPALFGTTIIALNHSGPSLTGTGTFVSNHDVQLSSFSVNPVRYYPIMDAPRSPTHPPNFLTFDIEEWYRVNYDGVSDGQFTCAPGWMERLVDTFLDICHQANCISTFFILGSVAEDYPQMVRRIAAAGHEVASHSYAHQSVHSMSPLGFGEDLRRSCGILGS